MCFHVVCERGCRGGSPFFVGICFTTYKIVSLLFGYISFMIYICSTQLEVMITTLKNRAMNNSTTITRQDAIEIINKEMGACFAFESYNGIEVTYRGKKTEKIYIVNGEVTYKGNCGSIASQIAERFNLVFEN